jgi:hypothetical protein
MLFCLLLTGSRGGFGSLRLHDPGGSVVSGPERRGGRRWRLPGLWSCAAWWWRSPDMVDCCILGPRAWKRGRIIGAERCALSRIIPWIGTGPGTFGSIYPMYKTASDRGSRGRPQQLPADVVGFGVCWRSSRLPRCGSSPCGTRFGWRGNGRADVAAAAICGALVGWTVHGLVDFDLYVPGVALPAFVLLGTLQGLKELPKTDTVAPRRRENWLVAGLCVVLVVAAVLWIDAGHWRRRTWASKPANWQASIGWQLSTKPGGRRFGALEFAPSVRFGPNRLSGPAGPTKHSLHIVRLSMATRTGRPIGGNWQTRKAAHGVDAEALQLLSRKRSS